MAGGDHADSLWTLRDKLIALLSDHNDSHRSTNRSHQRRFCPRNPASGLPASGWLQRSPGRHRWQSLPQHPGRPVRGHCSGIGTAAAAFPMRWVTQNSQQYSVV